MNDISTLIGTNVFSKIGTTHTRINDVGYAVRACLPAMDMIYVESLEKRALMTICSGLHSLQYGVNVSAAILKPVNSSAHLFPKSKCLI